VGRSRTAEGDAVAAVCCCQTVTLKRQVRCGCAAAGGSPRRTVNIVQASARLFDASSRPAGSSFHWFLSFVARSRCHVPSIYPRSVRVAALSTGTGTPRTLSFLFAANSGAGLHDLMAHMSHGFTRATMIYQHESCGADKPSHPLSAPTSHVIAAFNEGRPGRLPSVWLLLPRHAEDDDSD
jgi:hypothetical protein